MERENLHGDAKGKGPSGANREVESTDVPARSGLLRSSDEAGVMPVERRERVIAIDQVNCGRVTGRRKRLMINGRRQSSCDGTSRMNREIHVRICEKLGVKFPGPTRHSLPMRLVPRLARCPEYPESRHEAPAQYLTRWAKRWGNRPAACGYLKI
jgi:hypothetical protein